MPLKRVIRPIKKYNEKQDRKNIKYLRKMYGQNKTIPKECELQALRALSHYPELIHVHVEFRFRKQKLGHSSQPNFKSLFDMYKERSYIINISTEVAPEMEKSRFPNLSYNAQIGVLCHELAHTSEYIRKSSFWLIVLGAKYISGGHPHFKQCFENRTDMRAIHHGAGYQLLAWSKEAHHMLAHVGRGKHYLTPAQIKKVMTDHHLYD